MKTRFALLCAALLTTAVAAPALAQPGPGDRHEHRAAKHKEMLEKLDANKDGAIDREEFQNARAGRFAEMDGDKDGRLTQADFQAAAEKRATERRERMAARMFERLDADKDGAVTQEEFLAKSGEGFDRMDRNDDGTLSPDDRPDDRRRGKH